MPNKTTVTESRFNMWRALTVLAHADHKVTQEERNFILDKLNHISFSKEQRETLIRDLEMPPSMEAVFPKIKDKTDRADLIYFGRMLFWADGDFDRQEEALLENLNERIMSKLDLESIMKEFDEQVHKGRIEFEAQKKKGPSVLASIFDHAIGKFVDV